MSCTSVVISNAVRSVPVVLKDNIRHPSVSLDDSAVHPEFGIGNATESVSISTCADKAEVKMSIGQICSIYIKPYLRVDRDVLWVTPDVWEKIMVETNCNWVVL